MKQEEFWQWIGPHRRAILLSSLARESFKVGYFLRTYLKRKAISEEVKASGKTVPGSINYVDRDIDLSTKMKRRLI